MPGQLVSHETYLSIDVEFIGLRECFEAYRRGMEYAEANNGTLVITNAPDTLECQTKNQDSVLLTLDEIHNVLVMRIFLADDRIIKPIYIYNQREYQIACEFHRQILKGDLEPKEEWLS